MYVQPYVFFNGRCEEALKYYGEKLGAEIIFQMRYKDAPPDAQARSRPGTEDKIMHATHQARLDDLDGVRRPLRPPGAR